MLQFTSWNEDEVTLKTLSTVIQRLGGRRQGAVPGQLKYSSVLDTPQLYCARTEPRDRTVATLAAFTPWTTPPVVDLMIHQQYQQLKATIPMLRKNRTADSSPSETKCPAIRRRQWRYSWSCWLSSEKEEESCSKATQPL